MQEARPEGGAPRPAPLTLGDRPDPDSGDRFLQDHLLDAGRKQRS